MNRRNFLKFVPVLPVIGVGTAMASVTAPEKLSLPLVLEGEDGVQLIIDQDGDAVSFNREGMPDGQHTLLLHKPVSQSMPGLMAPNEDLHFDQYSNWAYTPGFWKE